MEHLLDKLLSGIKPYLSKGDMISSVHNFDEFLSLERFNEAYIDILRKSPLIHIGCGRNVGFARVSEKGVNYIGVDTDFVPNLETISSVPKNAKFIVQNPITYLSKQSESSSNVLVTGINTWLREELIPANVKSYLNLLNKQIERVVPKDGVAIMLNYLGTFYSDFVRPICEMKFKLEDVLVRDSVIVFKRN